MNESFHRLGTDLGIYLMKEEEIPLAAECNAEAYVGYTLYDLLFGNRCTPAKVNRLWKVSLSMVKDVGLFIADGPKINGMALFMPPGYTSVPAGRFIKSGGLALSLPTCKRLATYQNYCMEMRERHTHFNCWYLLNLAIRPGAINQDLGSKMISPVLAYISRQGLGCFVETQEQMEVGFYEHHGFEVVEKGRVPGTDEPLYAMYRE